MKTIHIKVFGKVQGVGFRYFTEKLAKQYHITGTVQNVKDYVEIYATGSDALLNFEKAVVNGASPMSKVESYTSEEISLKQFDRFTTLK
ncbi:acylphosphatase [Macrococcoides canis]|uniref:acylphosphatase n=1 Tax=Macrococcoides canis TaxID=1855823 RepID=A0AAE6X2C0_9STAP|nr:acylphosphatase [Macrococcus canis]QCT74835.1 acylphosphatase [Macrococcus canis]QIH78437.1 acylphosphatase [Macrococcus canis]